MDYISSLPKSQKEKAFALYSKATSKGLKDANWMIAMLVFQVFQVFPSCMDRKLAMAHAEKASRKNLIDAKFGEALLKFAYNNSTLLMNQLANQDCPGAKFWIGYSIWYGHCQSEKTFEDFVQSSVESGDPFWVYQAFFQFNLISWEKMNVIEQKREMSQLSLFYPFYPFAVMKF